MLRSFLALALLAVLPAVASAAPPDYSGYQSLLDRYLQRVDPRSKTTDTRFDYEQLYLDERIQFLHRSTVLEKVHQALFAVRPAELAPAERTAWAINAYNFLVIEQATLRLLIPGKHLTRFRSVDEMRAHEGPFFASPVAEVDGRPVTLAGFERRYVWGDSTPVAQPRRVPSDPRRSLALCAGHLGDPPLAPRAYRGDSLEAQLDAAARTALAQPSFTHFHEDTRRLELSAWFDRRLIEYGGTPQSIVPFLARFGPPELRRDLKRHPPVTVALSLRLDPMLNQASRSGAMPDAPGPSSN